MTRPPRFAGIALAFAGCCACGAPKTEPAPPAAQGTDVGVAECDDFLRKQQACYEAKLPADSLPAATQTLDAMRRKWRAMKTDPHTSATLAMTCATAKREATLAMQELGCSW